MRKRNPSVAVIVGVVGAALIGLLVYGITTRSPSRTLDEALASGLRPLAPSSTQKLPVLGAPLRRSLASYAGDVVVLSFWASWCEPCREEAPRLELLQLRLLRHHALVLGVTYKDAASDSVAFIREYRLIYPNLRDTNGEFAHSYGTDALPESFLIDRSGRIADISRGEVSEEFVNRAVALARNS